MSLVALVTSLILIEYFVFVILVGRARAKTGIKAPAVTGDPLLERAMRVQLNTLEQMVVIIPAMWIYAQFVSENVAAGLGMLFVIGRVVYCTSYMKDPDKRTIGFTLGMLASVILMLGALYGTGMAALAG